MYTLVLLSGGVGSRMHNNIPKQYMLLAGKPMIMHVIEKVDVIDSIAKIVIVCADDYQFRGNNDVAHRICECVDARAFHQG